jgi:hypothetical protein
MHENDAVEGYQPKSVVGLLDQRLLNLRILDIGDDFETKCRRLVTRRVGSGIGIAPAQPPEETHDGKAA